MAHRAWDASMNRVAALALVALVSRSLEAQRDPHEAQPERPTVATHAGTVAPGWLEIETGVERDRLDRATSFTVPIVAKFGVASHVQISLLESVGNSAASPTALGDAAVGVKWRLLDSARVLGDFAVLPAVKVPTNSIAHGGTGTTDVALLLISSHQFGDVEMDVNAGVIRRTGDGSRAPRTASLWTVAFGGQLGHSFGWTGELYGYPATSGPSGARSIVAVLAGPTYMERDWLVFDAGVIIPMTGPQPRAIYAGGVYNVGHLF
jgi:hypothetical protein